MNWKESAQALEKDFGHHCIRDWSPALPLAKSIILHNSENVEATVRVIYILHNILVEEEYPNDIGDAFASWLRECFCQGQAKFHDVPEYLFFVGKIVYVSEWYFGVDDDFKPLIDKLAYKMQKKAHEKEPNNLLYKWACLFSEGDKSHARIAAQILSQSQYTEWLRSKGYPGEYILTSLEYSKESFIL